MAKMMRLAGALDKTARETRNKGSITLSNESASCYRTAARFTGLVRHSERFPEEMRSLYNASRQKNESNETQEPLLKVAARASQAVL
jgi:hypothetical protein